MTRMIAGHTMIDGPGGTACKYCGTTWLYLLDRQDQWIVGKPNIAHAGNLIEIEVEQLHREKERAWKVLFA